MADRLDELDSVIAGKGVLQLMAFRLHLDEEMETGERAIHVTVGFQSVLAEARQQAATFKALLAEIKKELSASRPPGPVASAGVPGPLDELARRRQTSSQR